MLFRQEVQTTRNELIKKGTSIEADAEVGEWHNGMAVFVVSKE